MSRSVWRTERGRAKAIGPNAPEDFGRETADRRYHRGPNVPDDDNDDDDHR